MSRLKDGAFFLFRGAGCFISCAYIYLEAYIIKEALYNWYILCYNYINESFSI